MDLTSANTLMALAQRAITHTGVASGTLRVGVDLGTAFIVLVVIDDTQMPIAVEMEYAQVLKDGLVVDYKGACDCVKKLKAKLEQRLNQSLLYASIAVPPGTSKADANTHKHVVESAGLEVMAIVDEPTAANKVMQLKSGVIVDIGGGTTGLSILQHGEVIYVADEATGGTHVSLVISGHYKMPFEMAELFKREKNHQTEVFGIVRPVFEKMATIVKNHIESYGVEQVCLVGGTCLFPNIENIFESIIGISTVKPDNPLLVTPVGIAMCCEL